LRVVVRPERQELRAAAQAGRAHARALRHLVERQRARAGRASAQQSGVRHEHVAHVLPLGEGDDLQPLRDRGGHVLGGVHGHVDAPVEQGCLQLLGEEPLVADLGERRVEDLVALRVDDLNLHAQVREALRNAVAHPFRLHESEA
jgi:hypothetical protein